MDVNKHLKFHISGGRGRKEGLKFRLPLKSIREKKVGSLVERGGAFLPIEEALARVLLRPLSVTAIYLQ
jgi:hypothetical protein